MSNDLTNPTANAKNIGRYVDLSLKALQIVHERNPTLNVTRAQAADLEAGRFSHMLQAHLRGLTTQALEYVTPSILAHAIEVELLNAHDSIESSIIELRRQAEFNELYGEVKTMRDYGWNLEKPVRVVMDEQSTYRERQKEFDRDDRFQELVTPLRRATNTRNPDGRRRKTIHFSKSHVENAQYLSDAPVAPELEGQLFLT
tara:strand:+ start:597 stop:1199 length:603 start_codon:yes stop_codon:yes gene_type:complete